LTVPNLISLCRLFSVPLMVWLLVTRQPELAFWVFIAAGVSDAIDGLIAKHFGQSSQLGAYLDPIADKVMLVSIYVVLSTQGAIPSWVAILVVSRDVLIVGGLLLSSAIGLTIAMHPFLVSKVNTLVQIIGAGIALSHLGYGIDFGLLELGTYYAIAITTIASGTIYVIHWARIASSAEGPK